DLHQELCMSPRLVPLRPPVEDWRLSGGKRVGAWVALVLLSAGAAGFPILWLRGEAQPITAHEVKLALGSFGALCFLSLQLVRAERLSRIWLIPTVVAFVGMLVSTLVAWVYGEPYTLQDGRLDLIGFLFLFQVGERLVPTVWLSRVCRVGSMVAFF